MLYCGMTLCRCTGGPFFGPLVYLAGVVGLHGVHGLVHTVAVTVQLLPGHELRRGLASPCLLQNLMKISRYQIFFSNSEISELSPPTSDKTLRQYLHLLQPTLV